MAGDDRVAATLAGIRRRFSNTNYATTTDSPRLLSVAMASAADVPSLLATVEAALKLADEWDAKAREIADQITYQDTEGAVAGFKMIGATRYQEDAKALRAAITAALAGEEASDGD